MYENNKVWDCFKNPLIKLKFSVFVNFICVCLGYLGLEPRTYRLKAEYSTIELVTLFLFL